jgi:hypothetical protein
MGTNYQLKSNRASPSSYGKLVTRKPKKRGPKLAPTVVPRYSAHPPTQDERVVWARREWRAAISRANAARKLDPVLNAAVVGRRRDLDRELAALDRIAASTRAASCLWTPPHARIKCG